MSYSLVFARERVPLKDKEAWLWVKAQMGPYYHDKRGPHPRFKELHDLLAARHPCICSLPDDQVDDSVWSDGPLISNFGQDISMVAFSFRKTAEVLPFILQTAAGLQMTVFDHQTHSIHRP